MTPMGPTKLHVMPLFEIGPLEPRFSEWLVFEGAPFVRLPTRGAISARQVTAERCSKALCKASLVRNFATQT